MILLRPEKHHAQGAQDFDLGLPEFGRDVLTVFRGDLGVEFGSLLGATDTLVEVLNEALDRLGVGQLGLHRSLLTVGGLNATYGRYYRDRMTHAVLGTP
jgi:hypothetical protein